MKLADIPRGSPLAYRCAAKQVVKDFEFALETCSILLGTEREKLIDLLASEADWSVFLLDEEDQ